MHTIFTSLSHKIISLVFLFSILWGIAGAQSLPLPDHIVILIEENQANAFVIGNTSGAFGNPTTYAPYINALANDSMSALFTQMFALEHPSQPDYLDFFAGGNQGVTDDNVPASFFTSPNLARELLDKGRTFITYSQNLPSVGSDVASSNGYARKHNPVTNWVGTGTNQVPATCNQPLTAWPTDFSTLPTVSYVVPTEDSDMHNGFPPGTITTGDYWFKEHLDNFIQWARTHNTLFIFTFDEDDGLANNNIPTFFFGPMVKHGTYTENANLYSMLRTIEDIYATGNAGAAATTSPILDCWKAVSGVNNISGEPVLSAYPNPASSLLRFSNYKLNTASEISICDVTGRVISQHRIEEAKTLEVDISAYPAGLYFYRVAQDKGVLQAGKFIVAH